MASRRVAALRVVLVSYPVAMVLLAVLAFGFGGQVSTPAIVWGALCGISQAFGVWWFYAALAAGPMSLVSPLTAILVAGVPVGFGVAMGERPSAIAYCGIALALVAIVLVSREVRDESDEEAQANEKARANEKAQANEKAKPHRFTKQVAWLTVGSGLAFGLNFVLIDQAPVEARLWPLVFARISASALVLVIAAFTRDLAVPSGVPLKLAVAAGVIDTVSNVAMLLALQASMLSLASVLISLYPAGTVGLALVVLKERVTRWQAIGMVLALVSVAMIATG